MTDDAAWHRILWVAALVGFASSWILGVGSRILPTFLGCVPRWPRVHGMLFGMYQAGAVFWAVGMWPDPEATIVSAARVVGGGLLVVSVVLYTVSLGLFSRTRPAAAGLRSPHDGWQRYVFAAWSWLFVSLALGPVWTIGRTLAGAGESPLVLDLSRHALAFGFATQMVLGVASRVVPNFTGKPLWSLRARDTAFYFLNASMIVRGLELPIAFGFWIGAWSYIAWAGPLGVAAIVLFATNIVMTVRPDGSPQSRSDIPVQALQPLPVPK